MCCESDSIDFDAGLLLELHFQRTFSFEWQIEIVGISLAAHTRFDLTSFHPSYFDKMAWLRIICPQNTPEDLVL